MNELKLALLICAAVLAFLVTIGVPTGRYSLLGGALFAFFLSLLVP